MNPNYIKEKIKLELEHRLSAGIPVLEDTAPDNSFLQYPEGAITVTYKGSTYRSLNLGDNSSQERKSLFLVTLHYRSFLQLNSSVTVLEDIKNILRGLKLNDIPDRLAPVKDEFVGLDNLESIKTHTITFEITCKEFQDDQNN